MCRLVHRHCVGPCVRAYFIVFDGQEQCEWLGGKGSLW